MNEQHTFSVQVEGPNDIAVLEVSGRLGDEVGALEGQLQADEEAVVPIAVNLPLDLVDIAGRYTVSVLLNGKKEITLPLTLAIEPEGVVA